MPKPTKRFSPVSERMVSAYKGNKSDGRGADLLKLIKCDARTNVRESWGACRNTLKRVRRDSRQTLKCKNFRVILGNGLCMTCWDKEIESRANNATHRYNDTAIPPDEE